MIQSILSKIALAPCGKHPNAFFFFFLTIVLYIVKSLVKKQVRSIYLFNKCIGIHWKTIQRIAVLDILKSNKNQTSNPTVIEQQLAPVENSILLRCISRIEKSHS
jgi:hypothetical protein